MPANAETRISMIESLAMATGSREMAGGQALIWRQPAARSI